MKPKSETVADKVAQLWDQGWNTNRIARKLELTEWQVHRLVDDLVRRRGIEIRTGEES